MFGCKGNSNSAQQFPGSQVLIPVMLMLALISWGCGGRSTELRNKLEPAPRKRLPAMRHTIQVGAFANMNNAVRFTDRLRKKGIKAYHFRHETGLYKVRFGNYASRKDARNRAENLKSAGIIENYFIVDPKDFAAFAWQSDDSEHQDKL